MKKNLLLFCFSLGLALLAAELFFRVEGKYACLTELTGQGGYKSQYMPVSDSWYRIYEPNSSGAHQSDEFNVSWKSNNEGLRGDNFDLDKPDSTCRILVLGDSFTEGIGSSGDSSYPQQLEDLLQSTAGIHTEVLNCGISGADPFFEYRILKDRLLKYRPDMVVVTINTTDITETIIRSGFDRFDVDSTVHYKSQPWFEPLYGYSYLVRRVVHDVFKYDRNLLAPGSQQLALSQAHTELNVAIDSFAMLCSSHKIKLLLVFHPDCHEILYNKPYPFSTMVNYCCINGIQYIDVRQQFYQAGINSSNVQSLYWKKDGHFNNTGYLYLARAVLPGVLNQLNSTLYKH